MTPKEKAEELVAIYKNLDGHPTEEYLDSEDAKMCAIKAVNQIVFGLGEVCEALACAVGQIAPNPC